VASLQPPKECDNGPSVAAGWWIAPADVQPARFAAWQPTPEEEILATRVERQIAVGHFRIPQIPAIAAKVVRMLVMPEADSQEISALIHEDQQLAADVVSFSNSSLFAGATKNTNIPQALGRVGFRRTRNLIFAASLRAAIYSGCEVHRAERLWRHACACAAISARIAQNVRCCPDDLYLAGLFHDVGKTVVLSLLDTIALRARQPTLRAAFVEHALELHHEKVGTQVVRHWGLPGQVEEAVSVHTECPGISFTRAQAVVTLANNACWRLNIGEVDDGRPIAGPAVLAALGATKADIPMLLFGVPEAARKT
jgi:putative nucleotidyltransferase with HDIG domain